MRRALLPTLLALSACGSGMLPPADSAAPLDAVADGASLADGGFEAAAPREDGGPVRGPFATRVVSFEPGPNAGFGRDRFPDIVLGPPVGGGDMRGGLDVLSLGQGGRLCLELGNGGASDGPGADLLVFENPFYPAGSRVPFAELAEVSVSEDGVHYQLFSCDAAHQGPPWAGCAGWNPVYSAPDNGLSPTDPSFAGGDPFDLASVGLTHVRFVCIHDLDTQRAGPPSAGFDLDAVAAVHPGPL